MTCLLATPRRLASVFALASAMVATASPAQSPQLVQSIPDANSPVERLGRYIRVLAASPRDLPSLLGAGQAALDVGDANAALGFFARAEEVAPSSGRVKAGLASSLVMIERPDDALRLFAEAVALGVPEGALARDRGLAYDLRGDTVRAQRDYATAMSRLSYGAGDDELIRRYALSLGIAGDRQRAMAMLDPLLRKQDQGAWRARAFIMAMTGDVSGANGVARQLMVPAMANAMAPLLSRLASLNPAERAHAVNFGTVPADGTQLAVQRGDPYLGVVTSGSPPATTLVSAQGLSRPPVPAASGDNGLIPAGEPLGPRRDVARSVDIRPVRVAQANSAEPRRRPGADTAAPAASPPQAALAPAPAPGFTAGERAVPVTAQPIGAMGTVPNPVPTPAPPPSLPPVVAAAPAQAVAMAGPITTPPAPVVLAPAAAGPILAAPPASSPQQLAAIAQPGTNASGPQASAGPAATTQAEPPSAPVPTSSATVRPVARLAGLLDGIETEAETSVALPDVAELRAARSAARKKMAQLAAQTVAEEAAKREKAAKEAAAKRHPARLWVQVATGRNDNGLALTLKRIRADNEAAMKGLSGWTAPYKTSNRILVGPMKSAAAARELVGKLAKNGVGAMTFSSDAGEEVEKIGK